MRAACSSYIHGAAGPADAHAPPRRVYGEANVLVGFGDERPCDLLSTHKVVQRGTVQECLSPTGLNRHGTLKFKWTGKLIDDQIASKISVLVMIPDR